MTALNWEMIQNGGAFESLMHALLFAEDANTILFGRPGKDAGQDARSADGTAVYQAKYGNSMYMDQAITCALRELKKIKEYREEGHSNNIHWKNAKRWILVANFLINPNDGIKWEEKVKPEFNSVGLTAEFWSIETLEGKLNDHPEIQDVFFGGENRVMVGLREARNFLTETSVGSSSFDKAIEGRDTELQAIKSFAESDDRRVLPVIGAGGIGKSRLMYEGLCELAQDDWLVYWALPEAMSRSSQWFRLLNSSKPTCVVIDDPNDPTLLRAVIEQLTTVERRNWKVIVATRSEKAEIINQYLGCEFFADQLSLKPLDEQGSKNLLRNILNIQQEESWMHRVHCFTSGSPVWLCLVAELSNKGVLREHLPEFNRLAALYFESCLSGFNEEENKQAIKLLRWIALWGKFKSETIPQDQAECQFLSKEGIPLEDAANLLERLNEVGLIKKWGINKRFYAVEPSVIRQYILTNWLFDKDDDDYRISIEGENVVKQLLLSKIPSERTVYKTLCSMAILSLSEATTDRFLEPIFDYLSKTAEKGDLLDQYRVSELVQKLAPADPESVIDVLDTIRKTTKKDETVKGSIWGDQVYTHTELIKSFPWLLYQVGIHITDEHVADKCLNQFYELAQLGYIQKINTNSGRDLKSSLSKLLCGSKNYRVFTNKAVEQAKQELEGGIGVFGEILCECILNPEREFTDWTAKWTLTVQRTLLSTEELNLANKLRTVLFHKLSPDTESALRTSIWRILASSHHSYHRAVLHEQVIGDTLKAYNERLIEDLKQCEQILIGLAESITVEESVAARAMWKWYIEYGKDGDLKKYALECEAQYESFDDSKWCLHNFFNFDSDREAETERIANILFNEPDELELRSFFEASDEYLEAVRRGHQDMADAMRIEALAEKCDEPLVIDSNSPVKPISSFVLPVLKSADEHKTQSTAWIFSIKVCQKYLLKVKQDSQVDLQEKLSGMLHVAGDKAVLLQSLYGNAHPMTVGDLFESELNILLEHQDSFRELHRLFFLLGVFYSVDPERVRSAVETSLENNEDNSANPSDCIISFVRSASITDSRYDRKPAKKTVEWIIDIISKHELDGSILGMYELEHMRDQAGFRLNMKQLVDLIKSRIQLETDGRKAREKYELFPYGFTVSDWASFDPSSTPETEDFNKLCKLALGESYTALYWMPRFISQLDTSGTHAATFVNNYLQGNPEICHEELQRLSCIASSYSDDSEAWKKISTPICEKANRCTKKERVRIYSSLSKEGSGVLSSTPGEVPDYYNEQLERAKSLRDTEPLNSPLKPYREWALKLAEDELSYQKSIAEEEQYDE